MRRKPLKSTGSDVGNLAVPFDNSFCADLSDGTDFSLAGETVLIASDPYTKTVKTDRSRAHPVVREFVNVIYDFKIYRVLNDFREIKR